MELVSVIIIGFNVEKTIAECIRSVIEQTYTNLEIVFIDDGSVDKTAEIVHTIEKKDRRIKYIYQTNSGANKARKTGFANISGKYCVFVDGDDLLQNNTVEICLNKIKSGKYDFICFDYYRFNADKDIIDNNHKYIAGSYIGEEFLEDVLKLNTLHYIWNKFYLKEFLDKIGFSDIPDITMGDDMAANVLMGVNKPASAAVPDKLYGYRISESSVSGKPNEKYYELIQMMDYIEKQLIKFNLRDKYKELLEFNYFINYYWYVVRNKYLYEGYQRAVYRMWKAQKINMKTNPEIKKFISSQNMFVRLLICAIDRCEFIEILLTRLYQYIK